MTDSNLRLNPLIFAQKSDKHFKVTNSFVTFLLTEYGSLPKVNLMKGFKNLTGIANFAALNEK
jgi:hypothetical protein